MAMCSIKPGSSVCLVEVPVTTWMCDSTGRTELYPIQVSLYTSTTILSTGGILNYEKYSETPLNQNPLGTNIKFSLEGIQV